MKYGVVTLVADPTPANLTTDTDTQPLNVTMHFNYVLSEIGDTMVNLNCGCIDSFRIPWLGQWLIDDAICRAAPGFVQVC